MNRAGYDARTLAVRLLVAGIVLALLAGIFLGVQMANGTLSSSMALLGAGIAFVPVAVLEGYGLYLLQRSQADSNMDAVAPLPGDDMQKQRQMIDVLRARGTMAMDALAVELDTDTDEVLAMLDRLVSLGVFNGYWQPATGRLTATERAELRTLSQCIQCGTPLQLERAGETTCPTCGTQYFLSEA